jgi:hypothetical protein
MFAWRHPLRSLRARLVSTYASLALLAAVVSAVYTTHVLQQVLLERIMLDLAGEAHVLAAHVAEPLANGDAAAVAAYIARVDPLTTARILVVDRARTPITTSALAPTGQDASLADALAGQVVLRTSTAGHLALLPWEASVPLVHVTVPVRAADGTVVGALKESYC